MDFDVGARLKSLREQLGLSQRELARRSGVTNGMISMIEQNLTSPSVASLRKVLDGLSMTLADFFSEEDMPPAEQVFFGAGELIELAAKLPVAHKGVVSLRQVGDLRNRNLQILHERYEPGADTGAGRNMLRHEGEEGGIVIEGEIELTVGDQKRVLGPGEAYFFDSRIPHRFHNAGRTDCVVISACTPPYL
ncbi:DNA-binding transcriptional repressor [uncultured Pleomorphomonas sp.]|uniref:DNA-binding transcriptional repressor n=1 Tax=uncultured Pleomorphomonas sp. TaxID=442121 RepID=A0A212LFW7_9HYPH|nr:cupin domain-containing protein [uncultured Pleomorphomonas sp.]SCM76466.1 DNA-binding transcriptional repressor [uncultured Pleomorphomonas sp.]